MEAQLAAVAEVSDVLNTHGIKHFIIGGIANVIWGQPRATQDADFKIIVGRRLISELVALVGQKFKFRVADPLAFAQRTFVLPFYASNQIPVDVGLGFLPYEEQAVQRSVAIHHEGVDFVVCSAEDLIIQKAVSEREKDWNDIEGCLSGKDLGSTRITSRNGLSSSPRRWSGRVSLSATTNCAIVLKRIE